MTNLVPADVLREALEAQLTEGELSAWMSANTGEIDYKGLRDWIVQRVVAVLAAQAPPSEPSDHRLAAVTSRAADRLDGVKLHPQDASRQPSGDEPGRTTQPDAKALPVLTADCDDPSHSQREGYCPKCRIAWAISPVYPVAPPSPEARTCATFDTGEEFVRWFDEWLASDRRRSRTTLAITYRHWSMAPTFTPGAITVEETSLAPVQSRERP